MADLRSKDEMLTASDVAREEGNKCFREGRMVDALHAYTKAIKLYDRAWVRQEKHFLPSGLTFFIVSRSDQGPSPRPRGLLREAVRAPVQPHCCAPQVRICEAGRGEGRVDPRT